MKKNITYFYIIIIGILAIVIITFLHLQPYYKKYHYVAHALGSIDGLEYSNSKEALEYSYSRGYRLMEADLVYTSDWHLVCRHKWSDNLGDGFTENNIPDYETFMSSRINGIYTPLDIESLIQFAMENPDVYFITDTKSIDDIYEKLEIIRDTAKKLGYKNLDRQFIIQFYNYENYEQISKKFSFENYIFTLYKMQDEIKENGIDNILDFCVENNIEVVTLQDKYATKEVCEKLEENGITSYVHTIDSRKRWLKLQLLGVDGIYTNCIHPYTMIYLYIAIVVVVILNIFIFLLFKRMILKIKKGKDIRQKSVCDSDI